jgi:hypothetical protein
MFWAFRFESTMRWLPDCRPLGPTIPKQVACHGCNRLIPQAALRQTPPGQKKLNAKGARYALSGTGKAPGFPGGLAALAFWLRPGARHIFGLWYKDSPWLGFQGLVRPVSCCYS